MPGWHFPSFKRKQVRFAYQNTFHSPPTPVLSSCSSISSESDGPPITPPTIPYPLPPQDRKPSRSFNLFAPSKPKPKYSAPAPYHPVIRINPLLQSRAIAWNIVDHPSTLRSNYSLISSSTLLHTPATNPPVTFMRITCPRLPWSIRVNPASNGRYITLSDVVDGIYGALRTNITQEEFEGYLGTPQERLRAARAYEARYRRLRSAHAYDEEKRGGMKRVDFLRGDTRFYGLSNYGGRQNEWVLDVAG